MNARSFRLRFGVTLLLLMAATVNVWAQINTGSITGVVQDQNKGAVMGATVAVTNERTGEERKVVTTADGLFVVTPLQPSFYTINVSKDGFASAKATGVQVTVGLEVYQNFALQLASVSETITVSTVRKCRSTILRRASA